jgi:hypothetical protein
MISLELSMVQHNQAESARLAEAMNDYLARGGVIEQLEVTRFVPQPFGNQVIAPSAKVSKAVHIQKSEKAAEFERNIADKLRAYIDLGVAAASKDLHLGTKRLNYIAANYGIVFKSHGHTSALAAKREREASLVPDVKKAFADGATQQDVIRKFDITKDRLRRMAKAHGFKLPGFVDEAADRKLIERITAIRDLGLPRRTCAKHLGIAGKKLDRIVEQYGVDYPLKKPGTR